jgi:hypothetical protein
MSTDGLENGQLFLLCGLTTRVARNNVQLMQREEGLLWSLMPLTQNL